MGGGAFQLFRDQSSNFSLIQISTNVSLISSKTFQAQFGNTIIRIASGNITKQVDAVTKTYQPIKSIGKGNHTETRYAFGYITEDSTICDIMVPLVTNDFVSDVTVL